jgi:hypothetical protein
LSPVEPAVELRFRVVEHRLRAAQDELAGKRRRRLRRAEDRRRRLEGCVEFGIASERDAPMLRWHVRQCNTEV